MQIGTHQLCLAADQIATTMAAARRVHAVAARMQSPAAVALFPRPNASMYCTHSRFISCIALKLTVSVPLQTAAARARLGTGHTASPSNELTTKQRLSFVEIHIVIQRCASTECCWLAVARRVGESKRRFFAILLSCREQVLSLLHWIDVGLLGGSAPIGASRTMCLVATEISRIHAETNLILSIHS
jgi:hypothetical protein